MNFVREVFHGMLVTRDTAQRVHNSSDTIEADGVQDLQRGHV
jgi:hypothetical protein